MGTCAHLSTSALADHGVEAAARPLANLTRLVSRVPFRLSQWPASQSAGGPMVM